MRICLPKGQSARRKGMNGWLESEEEKRNDKLNGIGVPLLLQRRNIQSLCLGVGVRATSGHYG